MSLEDFISALEAASNIEFSLVLRKPEELELMQKENEALRLQIKALEARLQNSSGLMAENIALRTRLKSAKKKLNSLGVSTEYLDF